MGAGGLGGLRDNRPNEPTEHGYCALVLSGKHDLYALKCPDVVKAAVRTSFGDIKSEGPSKKSTGLYKFTFGSSIWTGSGGKGEQAVVRLIDALREVGWYLEVDAGMSRTTFMQVWVLKKRDPLAQGESCLLGLHDKADVRLVVHDTDDEGDRKADAIIKGISSTLKVEKEEDTPDGRLMKLAGHPFLAEEEGTVAVRQMVLAVSCELEKCYGNIVTRSVKLSNNQYSKSSLIFYSQGDNQQQPKDTIYVGVSLHDEDKIRIYTTPGDALAEDLGPSLELCLTEAWPYGIETKGVYGGSYQWQLKGSPWSAKGPVEIDAQLLIGRILGHFWSRGFELMTAFDCSGKLSDMSTIVMRKVAGSIPSDDNAHACIPLLCVSFHDKDEIRLSSTDESSLETLAKVVNGILGPPCINVELATDSCGKYGKGVTMKLKVPAFQPGKANSQSVLCCGLLLVNLLNALEGVGWEFRAALDVSGKFYRDHRTANENYSRSEHYHKMGLVTMYFCKK